MKAIILKTRPYSMFRLGSGSLNETDDMIHSDTLFSALVSVHARVFENTDEFIEAFAKGKIKISSGFPMLADNEMQNNIFFLPKPELNYTVDDNIKEEKKIKYISAGVFNHLKDMAPQNGEIKLSVADPNYFSVIGSSFSADKTELEAYELIPNFISHVVTPKTKVHSKSQEDSFYHQTDIQLIPIKIGKEENTHIMYPHFYFFYELSEDLEKAEQFFTCLRILADEGIGGERSTGKGQFESIIETQVDIEKHDNSHKFLLLSLFNPASQDEFDNLEKYEILMRGGGSVSSDTEIGEDENKPEFSDYRRKQVRMIAEGAVVNKNINGRLVDISPSKGSEFSYYRNGKSFTIPLG